MVACDEKSECKAVSVFHTEEVERFNEKQLEKFNTKEIQDTIATHFRNLNIEEIFRNFITCGSLLQIALTAAGSEKCSVFVLNTLSQYQNVVSECKVLSGSFVHSCVIALRAHQDAWVDLFEAEDEGDVTDAFDELEVASVAAKSMTENSTRMIEKIDGLKELSHVALMKAQEDKIANKEERKKMEKSIQLMHAKMKKYTVKLDELTKEYELERKTEKEARDRANLLQDRVWSEGSEYDCRLYYRLC